MEVYCHAVPLKYRLSSALYHKTASAVFGIPKRGNASCTGSSSARTTTGFAENAVYRRTGDVEPNDYVPLAEDVSICNPRNVPAPAAPSAGIGARESVVQAPLSTPASAHAPPVPSASLASPSLDRTARIFHARISIPGNVHNGSVRINRRISGNTAHSDGLPGGCHSNVL